MKPLKLVLSLLQSICTDNLGQQGSSRLTRKPLHRSRRSETSSPVQSHPRKNKMGLTTSTKQNLSMTRTSERKYDCKFYYFTWIMMKIVFLVLSLFQCYYWLKYMYAISIIFLQSKTLSPFKYYLFELSAMLQWRCIEREHDQLIEKSLLK